MRFAELLARLPGPAANGEEALAEVVGLARAQPDPAAVNLESSLAAWAPVIELVVAATGGDTQAAQTLAPHLDELAGSSDWGALVGALRRVLDGERDEQPLLDGLDEVDSAILSQTLHQLADQPTNGASPTG